MSSAGGRSTTTRSGPGRSWCGSARVTCSTEGGCPSSRSWRGSGWSFAIVQSRRREPPRVLIGLGLVSMVLFFGRPTLGFVIDLLPGGGDLFLRRFINGVHLAALYLAGLGLMFVVNLLMGLLGEARDTSSHKNEISIIVWFQRKGRCHTKEIQRAEKRRLWSGCETQPRL